MSFTLEQKRIAAAYALVDRVPRDKKTEWKTLTRGFGAEVQRCGLLQTIAFVQRNGDIAGILCKGLRGHMIERRLLQNRPAGDDECHALLRELQAMDSDLYMLVTREALAFSVWLKRASSAEG